MIMEAITVLTLEHWQTISAILVAAIGYAYGVYRMVGVQIDDKLKGCNMIHTRNVEAVAEETKQIRENYLARFEEVKHEIRETKKDVLERIDMIVELLKLKDK